MTQHFWSELTEELNKSVSEKEHPYRFVTLGTVGNERLARLRTVVLRHVNENLNLIFYTDKRSKKVLHIKENNRVSMLFYHPELLLQLKVEGLAYILKDEDAKDRYWNNIHENSKKDYTTHKAPGSEISNPDQVEYLTNDHYFCAIEVEPFKIEYLKLKRPNHIRVRFSKENSDWNGEFLVP